MKISGNDIRPGQLLEHKGRLWMVAKIQHTQPGKGGAYMQVEMKDVRSGTKLNERFRSSETVERIRLDEKDYQYLFEENDQVTLMDQVTFEQLSVPKSLIGEPAVFLQENMNVTVSFYDGDIIQVHLPTHVTMVIREAEAVVKGQTASSSFKPAILENGVRVMVPPHIDSGTKIVVDTQERTYVERAK